MSKSCVKVAASVCHSLSLTAAAAAPRIVPIIRISAIFTTKKKPRRRHRKNRPRRP